MRTGEKPSDAHNIFILMMIISYHTTVALLTFSLEMVGISWPKVGSSGLNEIKKATVKAAKW